MKLKTIKDIALLNLRHVFDQRLQDHIFKAVAIVNIHGDFNRLGMKSMRENELQMDYTLIDLNFNVSEIDYQVADIYIKGSIYYIYQWYGLHPRVDIKPYYDAYQTALHDGSIDTLIK